MTAPAAAARPAHVIPGLDGIRAVAILLVIMWHVAHTTRFPPPAMGPFYPFTALGWAGVDLFFALSGFLITGLLLDEERATGRLDLGRFYLRRALRIFPAFYLVLALDLLVLRPPLFASLANAMAGGGKEVLSLLTYWSNYYYVYLRQAEPPPALSLFWSLCVEEHFYLLWPVFLAAVRSARTRLLVAAGACALLPVARWAASAGQEKAALQMLSHFRLDSLLWGALAALLLPWLLGRRRAVRLALAGSLGLVVVLFATGHMGLRLSSLGYSLGFTALALFGSALGLEATGAPAAPLARALGWAPLRAIGRVSYGMYLVHFQVIDLVAPAILRSFPRPTTGVFMLLVGAAAAGSYAVAALMYELYERRFLRLKDRLTPPRETLLKEAA